MKVAVQAVVVIAIAAAVLTGVTFGQEQIKESATTVLISGRILDPSGAVIPNTSVKLKVIGASGNTAETRSDQRGRFSFPAVPPQKYELRMEANGFTPVVRTIEATPGSNLDVADVVLQMITVHAPLPVSPISGPQASAGPIRISGRVAGLAINGPAAANVTVTLRRAGVQQPTARTKSAEDGSFSFSPVPLNDYELYFESQGFRRQLIRIAAISADPYTSSASTTPGNTPSSTACPICVSAICGLV